MLDYTLSLARAIEYEKGKQRVAAVLVDRWGNPISSGTNSYVKTHPLQKHYATKAGNEHREYLHAEIAAIIRAQGLTGKGTTMYIARIKADGSPALAAPCPVCQLALAEAGITNVVYTEAQE